LQQEEIRLWKMKRTSSEKWAGLGAVALFTDRSAELKQSKINVVGIILYRSVIFVGWPS